MSISPYLAELRRLVGSRRLVLPAVAVVVHDGYGRLLMVRARESDEWGLPAGGIEPGESPRAAARRELLEETGHGTAALRLVGAVGGEPFRHRYPNGDEVEYQLFVFSATVEGGEAPNDTAEIAEVRWFPRGQAPALALPYPDDLLWPGEDATPHESAPGGAGAVQTGRSDSKGVRLARPADRAELVRMRRSLWPDSTAGEVDALLGGEGQRPYRVLVAEGGDGGLVGFAEIGERPFAEGCATSPVAYLEGIWVDAPHRRAGVGATLVEACLVWARSRGLTELASDADIDNGVSHRFHRAVGFEETGRVVCFRRAVE